MMGEEKKRKEKKLRKGVENRKEEKDSGEQGGQERFFSVGSRG